MAKVLMMPALELGDPVPLFVLVVTDNAFFHVPVRALRGGERFV